MSETAYAVATELYFGSLKQLLHFNFLSALLSLIVKADVQCMFGRPRERLF